MTELKVRGMYLVRYHTYTTGNLWLAKVEAVTDLCYLINDRWYLKDEFHKKYKVFEEVKQLYTKEGQVIPDMSCGGESPFQTVKS